MSRWFQHRNPPWSKNEPEPKFKIERFPLSAERAVYFITPVQGEVNPKAHGAIEFKGRDGRPANDLSLHESMELRNLLLDRIPLTLEELKRVTPIAVAMELTK